MNSINDCSKFTSGTPEHTFCEGENSILLHKQAQDADCNKRIEEAKKNSLAAMMQKFDCKEPLPSLDWGDYLWSLVTPQNIAWAVAVAAPTIGFIHHRLELNFLRNAAEAHPHAQLGTAMKHKGVVMTPPRVRAPSV